MNHSRKERKKGLLELQMPCCPHCLVVSHRFTVSPFSYLSKSLWTVAGSSGTEMGAVPEGSLGAAHGTGQDLSEAPGEELLPKALLHFPFTNPQAQPRTAKAPLKASRKEERFGSHSSSACLRFEREDSLFRAGTCSDRAGFVRHSRHSHKQLL